MNEKNIYLIYNADGEITGSFIGPERNVGAAKEPGDSHILWDGVEEKQKVDLSDPQNPRLAPTEAMPVVLNKQSIRADGVDELHITGIEAGSRVIFTGPGVREGFTDEDTDLIITVDTPGEYTLTFRHGLHLETEVTFSAT